MKIIRAARWPKSTDWRGECQQCEAQIEYEENGSGVQPSGNCPVCDTPIRDWYRTVNHQIRCIRDGKPFDGINRTLAAGLFRRTS